MKINPADVDAHRVLGSIYASLAEPDEAGKTPADAAENVRKAVEHLEKAHRADGTDRDAGLDLALARLYIQSDQDQKAADLLRRVIEYEPDAGEAYVLLAHVETSLGHAERATDALEAGASGNPRLLQTLAGLYETQQNWDKAAATYERLSGFNPGSVDVKTKWAAALLQTGDDTQATKARDLLVEANRAAPTEARPLYLLSVAERKRHDYSAAETAAKRLVALDPDGSSGAVRARAGVRGSAPLRQGRRHPQSCGRAARHGRAAGHRARSADAARASGLRPAAGRPGRRGHQDVQSRSRALAGRTASTRR